MKKILFLTLFIAGTIFCFAQTSAKDKFLKVKSITLSTGVRLEYVEQGKLAGHTILFVHGFTDSWHSFEYVMSLLPENNHAIAITLRGHGNSSKETTSFSLPDFSADLAAFVEIKKLKNIIIVGHSLGGLVAQQFVLDFPKLTKAIIIMGSDASFKDNAGIPEFIAEINKLSDPIPFEFASEFQKSTVYKPVSIAHMNVFIGESIKVPAHVWKYIGNSLLEIDFTKRLQQLDKPCLIIWGDKDLVCPKVDQFKMQSAIKNSKLLIYEDTGHALHWEDPERFVKDLLDFLKNL